MELVSFGVAAKIVVVVDHQHARFFARSLAEEISCRQPADPAPHHNQVVDFTGWLRTATGVPSLPIAEAVGIGVCAIVVSTHSGERRRIVIRRLLGGERYPARLL